MKFNLLFLFAIICSSCNQSSAIKIHLTDSTMAATDSAAIHLPSNDTIDSLKFDLFKNIEQIEFCLPLPVNYVKEDYEKNDSRAKHVFIGNNKQQKIIFQGFFTDTPFEQNYKNYLQEIKTTYTNAKIALSTFKPGYYAISWSNDNKIYYLKKWLTKDNDIIMAYFEYDSNEKEIFDKIISKVVNANPEDCN